MMRSPRGLLADIKKMSASTRMRNAILVLLVAQTTAIVLLMRYSRSVERDVSLGPRYRPTVAVFLAEAFKLPVCLLMCFRIMGAVTHGPESNPQPHPGRAITLAPISVADGLRGSSFRRLNCVRCCAGR